MTQLTALVTELRKEVCKLETSIEYEEERASSVPACIFVARQLRARRDNLLLTISTLENQDPIGLQYGGAVRRRRGLGECGMVEINRRQARGSATQRGALPEITNGRRWSVGFMPQGRRCRYGPGFSPVEEVVPGSVN